MLPDFTFTPHPGPMDTAAGGKSESTKDSRDRLLQSTTRSMTSLAATSSDLRVGTGSARVDGAAPARVWAGKEGDAAALTTVAVARIVPVPKGIR